MLFKIIIFSLIGWWLYSWYRWSEFKRKKQREFWQQTQGPQQIEAEDLISCETCHTYVPSTKVIVKKQKSFCSKECSIKYFSK